MWPGAFLKHLRASQSIPEHPRRKGRRNETNDGFSESEMDDEAIELDDDCQLICISDLHVNTSGCFLLLPLRALGR